MRIDITSLYFNGETKSVGNTASWGTALGQERPDYPISVEGGQEIVDLINSNHFEFIPSKELNHTANIKHLEDKIIYSSGKFDSVYVNNIKFKGPFFLLVIEETSGTHVGRKSLKYNNKITVFENSNEDFYTSISNYFGIDSCWFVYEINAIKGQLHMTAIKVNDKPMLYDNSQERKKHWESLINNFDDIKEKFKAFCLDIRGIKNESSVNEYIRAMPEVRSWFLENNICAKDFQIWDVNNDLSHIKAKLNGEYRAKWQIAAQKNSEGDYGFKMAAWNRWTEFVEWYKQNGAESSKDLAFSLFDFQETCKEVGLVYSDQIITRFIASLLTKPFVILTGLSGSGKTKLAQAFVQWICKDKSQYRIIPVGADWTNREPLLGYPNALNPEEYVMPDSGVIELILQANSYPELPHFMILDEMNLSIVERYFADFLSVMESNEEIPLYADGTEVQDIPSKLSIPPNLFIIGTVNIDETTNMFSPKVLDRANTIEFRINPDEMRAFLGSTTALEMEDLIGKGAIMANDFIYLSLNKTFATKDSKEINDTLLQFFSELQKTGAEFGYRSASEILRLINQLNTLNEELTTSEKLDIAIMQKLLPKLHGSRRKLSPILETLGGFCVKGDSQVIKDVFDKDDFNFFDDNVLFPLSLEKIARMYKGAVDNGFASYAEA